MRAFGCDVGNGYAYVSVVNDDTGQPECTLPPQWARGAGMPTEAYVAPDGSIDVGNLRAASHIAPGRTVRAVKRCLGLGRVPLTPVEGSEVNSVLAGDIYAAIAQKALDESHRTMIERGDEPPHQVVLTYPASFGDSRRLIATMHDAVNQLIAPDSAPYQVVGSIPEPAAIALDYLHFMRHEVAPARRIEDRDVNVVVYDLGHGTFDTALVTARAVRPGDAEQPWDLHDYDGLHNVGGIDFDEALVNLFTGRIQLMTAATGASSEAEDAFTNDLLYEAAQRCKHELSDAQSSEVRLILPNRSPMRFEVSRTEFERATEHLLDKTLSKLSAMFESAERLGIGVTHVVLSGGSSRMPMVMKRVKELVGDGVTVTLFRPSEAVSFGAARYARTLTAPVANVRVDDANVTADNCMDELFKSVLAEINAQKDNDSQKKNDAGAFVQHVPYPLGVLYAGSHGRVMRVLLPRGATDASEKGLMHWGTEGPYVELVVARALDRFATKRRLGEGAFREVCHLTCDHAKPDTVYDVRIQVLGDGTVTGLLTDEQGHTLRMEMR